MEIRRGVGIAVLVVATGCFAPQGGHRMRFEMARERAGSTVVENRSYFFWGLVPTRNVDVLKKCPLGVVAIKEGNATGGRFRWLPTFGVWARRSTTYYCRAGAERMTVSR